MNFNRCIVGGTILESSFVEVPDHVFVNGLISVPRHWKNKRGEHQMSTTTLNFSAADRIAEVLVTLPLGTPILLDGWLKTELIKGHPTQVLIVTQYQPLASSFGSTLETNSIPI